MSGVIAVALSGGVDSSVAARILKDQWDRMVATSHNIWPDSKCCNLDVLTRAENLSRSLGIPYYLVEMQESFRKNVVDNFIQTYVAGKTPNPCVRCNEKVRFRDFYRKLRQQVVEDGLLKESETLYFATGHYVRVEKTSDGYFLKKAKDLSKDQSYMLYKIPQEYLSRFVFPLGSFLKKEVMELAKEWQLPSYKVKESQDACFVDTDYVDFIKRETGSTDLDRPGEIVDLQGKALGRHRGYLYYTIGQRSGLGLGNGPWYVTRIEPALNRVVVGRSDEIKRGSFAVEEHNWFMEPLPARLSCTVKIRYNSGEVPCTVETDDIGDVRVNLAEPKTITPGQSAVFYKDDLVLGGGIIC